ncbi:hypothetical protein M0R04_08220 [Candidatus Dojkabacteria bacterium]|jgi:hypothetical protein|nr:hypothetical protein [Candidatus Dojkabacteria bacterium]
MSGKIKDFMYGGVGVTVAYYVIAYVVTLITGTTSSDTFFKGLVPTLVAVGGGLIILAVAFS